MSPTLRIRHRRAIRHRLALVAVLGGAASPLTAAAATPTTLLTIALRTTASGPVQHYSLGCTSAGVVSTSSFLGSPKACRLLAKAKGPYGSDPFAPVPGGIACSMIYGGPQTARVIGTFAGRRVDARFSRVDGCQTARWGAVAFLFPPLH